MPQPVYVLLLLWYDLDSFPFPTQESVFSKLSFGSLPRSWRDLFERPDAMSRPEEYSHIYADPMRGSVHLLGCRTQIIDNASVLYPEIPSERLRVILEVNSSGHYHATLIFDPGNRGRLEILLETTLPELLTPDMAYMNLLNVTARKVRERDVLRQGVGLGPPTTSGYPSTERE